MIARLRLLLPYTISVSAADVFAPLEASRGDSLLRLYPPYKATWASLASIPPHVSTEDIISGLAPMEGNTLDPLVTVNGAQTIPANALLLDLHRPSFDRARPTLETPRSPTDGVVDGLFLVANSWLTRFRSVARGSAITPVSQESTLWRLEFLNDDLTVLAVDPARIRSRNGIPFSVRVTALTGGIWAATDALPESWSPAPWETLLLDAEAHLPQIVPALVLAAASLEILISFALDSLAPTDPPASALWSFINDRGNDYRKEPSVAEQFDQLLKALGGHSLKERNDLWEVFMNLKAARNSLMHEGVMSIGKKPVTRDQAYTLIVGAKELAKWVEALLPQSARRPPEPADIEVSVTQHLIRIPPSPETPASEAPEA